MRYTKIENWAFIDPVILDKYPYRDANGTPFRLSRISEHEWNVFEPIVEMEHGQFVGFYEKKDDFDDCDTLEKAVKYWSKKGKFMF